jgi:hypothetical protein
VELKINNYIPDAITRQRIAGGLLLLSGQGALKPDTAKVKSGVKTCFFALFDNTVSAFGGRIRKLQLY